MDYTKVRQLIYRERQDISEFGIYEDNDSKVNPFLYERLKRVSYLHPSYAYADNEMLRMFNDVYFVLTAFFMDKRPLANYANYRRIANPNYERDMLSNNRSLVEVCMLYVILNRFNGANWFKEKKTHSEFFNAIREEVYRHRNPQDMETMLAQLRGAENIAYTITGECESMRFVMSVKEDFPPRDIQEVINSKESLNNCLSIGKDISVAVNLLCEKNEQKLKLVERLLKAEKEHYGVMDSTICAAYKSLYELKSELTGEPLPEMLPFEKTATFTPPMMPTQPIILEYQNNEEDEDDEEVDEVEETDDRDEIISELTEKVNSLTDEVDRLTHENSKLRKKITDGGESEWIGCFDGFLHSSLNPQAIAKALEGISHSYFPKQERGFWWVFVTVLTEINWIPKTNYKLALQWANLHFNCGWDWKKDYQFKFSDINEKIRSVQPSSKWNKSVTGNVIGDYYGELAKTMKETFVVVVDGKKMLDKKEFILPGCPLVNNGRK